MDYRREIDGLRALAVVPVIFYHAGFQVFSGGFVGVDVFFVISGYLITSIILQSIYDDKFSFIEFYERRIRRIIPALYMMVLFSIAAAWLILFPLEMKNFSGSLISVIFFLSNVLFYRESGYFTPDSELKPLIHTWSLSIEEQYYIIFPIMLIVMWRFIKIHAATVFTLLFFGSLFLAHWIVYKYPSFAFYLLPTRCWELLLGTLIAFLMFYKKGVNQNKTVNEILSALGVGLIIYSIFFFDKTVPFPSLYALVPTIGASLIIIFSGQKNIIGRLLSNRILVGVGLISYSAYLWHQPLFAFYKSMSFSSLVLNDAVLILLCCLTFFVAYLSYKFIEQPFRNKNTISRKQLVIFVVMGSAFIGSVGVYGKLSDGYVTGGFYDRYPDEGKELFSIMRYDFRKMVKMDECFLGYPKNGYSDFSKECYSLKNNETKLLIWGDSHAAALSYGFYQLNNNVSQLTSSGCPPILKAHADRLNCAEINDGILNQIKSMKPDIILLHAYWAHTKKNFHLIPETIDKIKEVSPRSNIYLIGSMPTWKPSLVMYLIHNKISLDTEISVDTPELSSLDDIENELLNITKEKGINYFSIIKEICDDSKCKAVIKNDLIYEPITWDYAHVTRSGAKFLSEAVMRQVGQ